MPPTTSDRFFALADRVESALPDAGFTKEQAAELVGSLRAYWERPTEQALETLRATQRRIWRAAISEGRLKRGHGALSANNALCRAAEEFFANESDPDMVVTYLAKCERQLGVAPPIPVRGVVTWPTPRRAIYAAVALDGSGVWAIGDSAEEAGAGAVDRREHLRDEAHVLALDFPDADTDAVWLDGLALVTLSGTTDSLRAMIKAMETGDSVAPWCPQDLWDCTSPTKEP